VLLHLASSSLFCRGCVQGWVVRAHHRGCTPYGGLCVKTASAEVVCLFIAKMWQQELFTGAGELMPAVPPVVLCCRGLECCGCLRGVMMTAAAGLRQMSCTAATAAAEISSSSSSSRTKCAGSLPVQATAAAAALCSKLFHQSRH